MQRNVEAAKRGVDSVDTGATMTATGRQRSVKPFITILYLLLKEKVNKYSNGPEVSTVGSENIRSAENDYKCQRLSTDTIWLNLLEYNRCCIVNADFRGTYAFAFRLSGFGKIKKGQHLSVDLRENDDAGYQNGISPLLPGGSNKDEVLGGSAGDGEATAAGSISSAISSVSLIISVSRFSPNSALSIA